MNTEPIVAKVWSFCTTLRDDGVSYGDYLEQLTYLIFLKMADEYSKPPYSRDVGIPTDYNWQSLKSRKGAELEGHYIALLRELATKKGMLGQIFTKAQNKLRWSPKTTFKNLVKIMVEEDINRWERWLKKERQPWDAAMSGEDSHIITNQKNN